MPSEFNYGKISEISILSMPQTMLSWLNHWFHQKFTVEQFFSTMLLQNIKNRREGEGRWHYIKSKDFKNNQKLLLRYVLRAYRQGNHEVLLIAQIIFY